MTEDIYADLPRTDFFDSATTHEKNRKIYSVMTTWDGSPTLSIRNEGDQFDSWVNERMHHPKGAWTETLYIYGHALEILESFAKNPNVYVVGLGCGYIEILTVAFWLSKYREPDARLRIRTFEVDYFLIDGFVAWTQLDTKETPSERFSPLHDVMNAICKLAADHFKISADELRTTMGQMYKAGDLVCEGPLNTEFMGTDQPPFLATAILYDAFSSKTDPYLWDEQFLSDLMVRYFEPQAVFGTYAARGVLNRALKLNNFKIKKVEGYGGKRESTYGLRF